jgi:hypothetical protein
MGITLKDIHDQHEPVFIRNQITRRLAVESPPHGRETRSRA